MLWITSSTVSWGIHSLSLLIKSATVQWTKLRITQVPDAKIKSDKAENPEMNTNIYWVNDESDISNQKGKNGLFNN